VELSRRALARDEAHRRLRRRLGVALVAMDEHEHLTAFEQQHDLARAQRGVGNAPPRQFLRQP